MWHQISPHTYHKVFGYGQEWLDRLTFNKLSTKERITVDDVRALFLHILDHQNNYRNIDHLGEVRLGTFQISNAYLPFAKDHPIGQFEDENVFYAIAYREIDRWFGFDYGPDICVVWPLMSEVVYLMHRDMADLHYYTNKSVTAINLNLGGYTKRFDANGHPFTEKLTFSRVYHVDWKGLFKKKPYAIRAVADKIHYTGDYDDRTRLCDNLDKTEEKAPFWFERHNKYEVEPLRAEIPPYIATALVSGNHMEF